MKTDDKKVAVRKEYIESEGEGNNVIWRKWDYCVIRNVIVIIFIFKNHIIESEFWLV